MNSPESLQRLLLDRGSLVSVHDLDPELPRSSYAFFFELGTTLVVAVEIDDTVAVVDLDDPVSLRNVLGPTQFESLANNVGLGSFSGSRLKTPEDSDVSGSSPWSSVVGLMPLWAWVLTNQRGYQDGLQLEFVAQDRKRSTIQLVAAANKFSVAVVG